jgi:hypothetical protein
MADTPTPIDPRLTGELGVPVTLPNRALDDLDGASDGEGNEGSEKRRKLNLWKCRQCRDARKKVRHSSVCFSCSWRFKFDILESPPPLQPPKLDEAEYLLHIFV